MISNVRVEPASAGTWEVDAELSTVSFDAETKRIFAVSPNIVTESFAHWCERVDPQGEREIAARIMTLRDRGAGAFHWVFTLTPHAGLRHVELTVSVHRGTISGTARDCSAQHDAGDRALLAIRESESRFRLMADGLPHIVWVHDATGQQEFVNSTFGEFFGVPMEEMTGDRWKQLLHPDDAEAYLDEFTRCVRARCPFRSETRVRRADGEWRWVESFARPRLNADRTFMGFVGTSVDVTDRKVAEANLKQARDEALSAAKAQERFLAMVTHELRAPLSPIMLLAESYLDDESLPLAVREDFCAISANAEVLSRLAADLSDLHAAEYQTLSLHFEAVELNRLVTQALRDLAAEFHANGVEVHAQLDDDLPPVLGDPQRLKQVLWNLLRNALKFTPPNGRVTVSATLYGGVVSVRVKDTGLGMTQADLARVFEPFAQGEAVAKSRRYGGLGLGLTIARMLVQGHGGQLRAESEGAGRGSCFTIVLPATGGHRSQETR